MRRMMFLVALLALPAVPGLLGQSSGTVLFRMDCGPNGAHYPTCGWDSVDSRYDANTPDHLSGVFRRSFLGGGGPGGRDAVRIAFVSRSNNAGASCDSVRAGWMGGPSAPAVPQGGTICYRYYVRYSNLGDVRTPASCGSEPYQGKLIVVNGSPDNMRLVEGISDGRPPWASESSNAIDFSWGKNIDGVPNMTEPVHFPNGSANRWVAVQACLKTNDPGQSNAQFRYYVNNDNQAQPTSRSTGAMSFNVSDCCASLLWMNSISPVGAGSSLTIDVTGFEIASGFDSSWSQRMGTGGPPQPGPPAPSLPAAPRNVRIIP